MALLAVDCKSTLYVSKHAHVLQGQIQLQIYYLVYRESNMCRLGRTTQFTNTI